MDKKISKKYLLFVILFITIFNFENFSYAKSKDKKKFLSSYNATVKELNQIRKLNKKIYNKFNNLYNKYDLKKLDLNENDLANFYFYMCDGSSKFEKSDPNKTKLVCRNADKLYEKNKAYKLNNFNDIEYLIAHILGQHYSWDYYFSGKKEDLNLAEKYIKKNNKLKDTSYNWYYVGSLRNKSIIYRADNKIKKAIKNHEQILKEFGCFKKRKKQKQEITCDAEKSNYAVLLFDTNTQENYEKGKKVLDEIIQNENKKNFDPDNRRATRLALSNFYLYYMNLDQAEKYLFDAIQFIRTLDERGKQDYYEVLNRLYGLYILSNNYYEAKMGLEKNVKEIKKELGEFHIILRSSYTNLLQIYTSQTSHRDLEKAKNIKNDLLIILKKNKKLTLNHDVSLAHIGGYYLNIGDFKKSEKYYQKALNLKKDPGYKFFLVLSKVALGKLNEAEKIIINQENNYNSISSYDHIGFLTAKSYLYHSKKDLEKFNKNALDLYLYFSSYSKGNFGKGNPDVSFYSSEITSFLEDVLSLNRKNFVKLNQIFESNISKDLNSVILELFEAIRASKFNVRVNNLIDRSKNSNIEKEKRELQDLKVKYENIPKSTNNKDEREKNLTKLVLIKDKISQKRYEIEEKLKISNVSNFKKEILVGDIQNNLKKNEAIISYFISENNLYINLIKKDKFSIQKIFLDYQELGDDMQNLIKSTKLNKNNQLNVFDIKSSHKLYNLLIKPIENDLIGIDSINVIPHKDLLSLPFEILVKKLTKIKNKNNYSDISFFGRNYSISYYPSIYAFYNLKSLKSKRAKNSFLGLGDPKFSNLENKEKKELNLSKLMSRGIANADEIRKMSELPETKDELELISKLFREKSKLYIGKNFNEKKIKSINFNEYNYISFATHAIIANQINNIAEPGLVLTPPEKSSLENDGILTVSEIEKLKLSADIVILSACNTASKDGSPDAEGLSGLTSAFFHAGTKSMLVTHWDVETNSAVMVTTGSLKNLENSESLSKALQKTKIEMMQSSNFSHPFFWAPFVLIGDIKNDFK